MSEQMMITKIEELKELEAFIEELKAEADGIRDSIKEQMTARQHRRDDCWTVHRPLHLCSLSALRLHRLQEGDARSLQGLHQASLFQALLHRLRWRAPPLPLQEREEEGVVRKTLGIRTAKLSKIKGF